MRAWLQLLRIALAPTVLWDLVAGALLAGGALGGELLAPLACLLLLFHGGMVLNDFADRRLDATERPHRPLAAERIGPGAAFVAAVSLLAGGAALALWALPSFARDLALVVLAIVLAYDLGGRVLRGAIGPPLLATARALSLALAGACLRGSDLVAHTADLLPYLAYWLYFLFLARLARREEEGCAGMRALAFVIVAALVPLTLAPGGFQPVFLLGWAAFGLWLLAPALRDRHLHWEPRRVQTAVRRGLAAAPAIPGLALLAGGHWSGLAAPLVSLAVVGLARWAPPE